MYNSVLEMTGIYYSVDLRGKVSMPERKEMQKVAFLVNAIN